MPFDVTNVLPSIPEFYSGSKILVTGGSSLLGRILVEKLLRSCPKVDTIYLLLDPKKTIQELTGTALFNRLREENPSSFKKLVVVDGSSEEVGLGLTHDDRESLQNEISVVFHLDDTVQIDDQPLRDAVLINVRGTRDLVHLALGMKNLRAFLYMSSTFGHFDKAEVLEQIYPVFGDWKTMIKIVENEENLKFLDLLTTKIVGELPNAYTYSKALAEHVINDFKDRLPLVIVRTSDVVSPVKEPYVGWVDNLGGRMSQWINYYTAISSVIYANPHQIRDYVPADLAAKSFIFIAWHRALSWTNGSIPKGDDVLPVYNCCSLQKPMEETELLDLVCKITENAPTMEAVWFPRFGFTTSWCFYYIRMLLFHLIPYTLMDYFTALNRGKPRLVRNLCTLFERSKNAGYLMKKNSFNFCNTNFMALEQSMLASDKVHFRYGEVYELNWRQVTRILVVARETILKDPKDTLQQARARMFRLEIRDAALRIAVLAAVVWQCYHNQTVCSMFTNSWDYIVD